MKCKGCGGEVGAKYPCRCGHGSSVNRIEARDVMRIAAKDMKRLRESVPLGVSVVPGPRRK